MKIRVPVSDPAPLKGSHLVILLPNDDEADIVLRAAVDTVGKGVDRQIDCSDIRLGNA